MSQQQQTTALVALLGLITVMHGCPSLDALTTVIIEQIGTVIPADLVTLNIIDLAQTMGGTVGAFHPPVLPTVEILPHFDRYLDQHPLVQEFQRTGDGTPRRLSDYIDLAELQRTDLYRYVFAPLQTRYQIAFSVVSIPGLVVGIGINRTHADFTDDELETATLLWRQIPAAFHHAQLREVHAREVQLDVGGLTPREREILVYLRAGLSNLQIAESLVVSRRTVEKHLEQLYAKLGVGSRTAAVHAVWPHPGLGAETP